jgi:AcrR family transcriptional regulator
MVAMKRAVGQHHGNLRRAIIDAALDVIAASHVDDVTLRAVARRAGVSAAAPYHHFADKDALLAAVALDGFEALGKRQLEILSGNGDAEFKLARMTAAYVSFAWQHETHYRVMFRALLPAGGTFKDAALEAAARDSFERLVGAIAAVNPALSTDQAVARALVAWSLAHGAVDVGRCGAALSAEFDAAGFANDVGAAVRRLAVEPPEDGGQH